MRLVSVAMALSLVIPASTITVVHELQNNIAVESDNAVIQDMSVGDTTKCNDDNLRMCDDDSLAGDTTCATACASGYVDRDEDCPQWEDWVHECCDLAATAAPVGCVTAIFDDNCQLETQANHPWEGETRKWFECITTRDATGSSTGTTLLDASTLETTGDDGTTTIKCPATAGKTKSSKTTFWANGICTNTAYDNGSDAYDDTDHTVTEDRRRRSLKKKPSRRSSMIPYVQDFVSGKWVPFESSTVDAIADPVDAIANGVDVIVADEDTEEAA